ncbi:transmembrane protein 177 [Onthophagus taurus]|uniref:transmembrane protein 177 n=1 Tax=Onthophagus taurus TaxID=166361 RepID=UPI0039BE6360
MAQSRFGKFLLTDSGRSFCMYTTLTLGTGVFCINYLPNTIFLNKYKEIVQLYNNGLSVLVSDDLKKKFNKAIDLIGIPKEDRCQYKPFMVYGFDIYSIGTPFGKEGGLVGLPINFTYTNTESIDKFQIRLNDASVVWDTTEGKQLLESYVLSDNAQIYGIARELKMLESPKFLLDTFFRTASIFGCYILCVLFNRRMNLLQKPRSLRFMLYAIVGGFTFGNYALAKDFTQVHYEMKIDKFLKEKDPIFVEGGKEFYEKMLLRNRALRKLLGKSGESYYSVLGNENYLIRQKHIPIVHRKEFFESKQEVA